MSDTLESLKSQKGKLISYQAGLGAVGTICGWVYANKSGGKFLRYLGFGFMGAVALGSVGYFTISPKLVDIQTKINKLEKDGES
jgi:hypothetical protein